MRKTIVFLLCLLTVLPAAAQLSRPGVEWGVLGGIDVPDYKLSDDYGSIRNRLGWHFGIVSAVKWRAVAIEPQILYLRQGLRVRMADGGESFDVRSNSIDVPLFASFRLLKPLRIYAGPVFTVMNDCKSKSGGDSVDFGRIRPTLSYSVGAGVVLVRHLLIDVRYNGQFRGKHDVVLPDGAQVDKLGSYSVAFSVGYLF
ncbi:MAG: PorT family protein [Alistipes sp.]|nr:PorT family protein [Alistipes sp.]